MVMIDVRSLSTVTDEANVVGQPDAITGYLQPGLSPWKVGMAISKDDFLVLSSNIYRGSSALCSTAIHTLVAHFIYTQYRSVLTAKFRPARTIRLLYVTVSTYTTHITCQLSHCHDMIHTSIRTHDCFGHVTIDTVWTPRRYIPLVLFISFFRYVIILTVRQIHNIYFVLQLPTYCAASYSRSLTLTTCI